MRGFLLKFTKLAIFLLLGSVLIAPGGIFAQKVPISFDDYHGYNDTVKYVKDIAKAYPNITHLLEIGKSTMGRSIYVLVISNMKTGTTIDALAPLRNMRKEGVKNVIPMASYQGKPGHWICGSTHGNEYTGTEVCLYTINQLVTGYGRDAGIDRLVDNITFYICPVVNPDGHYNSLEGGIPQRQNSMKTDDDADGKINEDGWDDLNGDGQFTRFRYQDPEGEYIIDDLDPRAMIRLERNEKTDKTRYSVVAEDKDNDGDGKRGEDSERGIDLNRNYPEGWFKDDGMAGGSGDYPTSSPEIHAIAEFFTNHPNILMAQNYHTSGGFTYRPMGTAPHPNLHPKDVAVLDFIMGKKYLEIIEEKLPEAWENPDKLEGYKAKLKDSKNKYAAQRGYILPRGWKVSYDEMNDRRYSYGMATDWMYKQYGIYAVTAELWNPDKDIPGFEEYKTGDERGWRERALLKYQDKNFGGKLFIPWKKFRHPELGDGEIGGWIFKYYGNNAFPGPPLESVCEKHWQFEMFRAELMPDIEISEATAKIVGSASGGEATVAQSGDTFTLKKGKSKSDVKIIEITAVVENKGKLATHLATGVDLPGNRQDIIWLIGDRDKITYLQGTPYQKLGVLEGTMEIPGYKGGPTKPAPSRGGRFFQSPSPMDPYLNPPARPETLTQAVQLDQTGTKREVKWLIAVEGNSPLKVVLTSQKGGTKVRELKIQ